MNIVTIWNYLSDTKKLIGKSNALAEALPFNCTTIEPPDIPEGQEAVFDTDNQRWVLRVITLPASQQMITVYSYTPDMMAYIGTANALVDLVPPNSTLIAPTEEPSVGCVLTFDTAVQAWLQTENHLGETVYDTQNGKPEYISKLGPYPSNTTTLSPDNTPYPRWDGSGWVTDITAQTNATVLTNAQTYKAMMRKLSLAICPLTSAVSLGEVLTADQQNTLNSLQQHAVQLAQFIQVADLTQEALEFPVIPPSLLAYPLALNPAVVSIENEYKGEL